MSTNVLDFLGDLGGFYQAIDLMVFMIGQFFSSKLFMASISSNFYFRKLSPKEFKSQVAIIEEKQQDMIKNKKFKEDLNILKLHDTSLKSIIDKKL